MPQGTEANSVSADQRRREVAAILARAVLRHRRIARIGANASAPESRSFPKNGLEL